MNFSLLKFSTRLVLCANQFTISSAKLVFSSCLCKRSNLCVGYIPTNTFKVQETPKMSDFTFPNDQPILTLDCEKAFQYLSEKEKLYAHYLSKASWCGGLISLIQTSLESPLICALLIKLFQAEPVAELKKKASQVPDFTDDDFTGLLVYACGIFSSMGNYKDFGDVKFVPNLSKEKFIKLIQTSKAASVEPEQVNHLLNSCVEKIYSLNECEKQLGFPDVGVTAYFSKNFTREDSEILTEFMKNHNIEAYNSRTFKTVDDTGKRYEIRLASIASTEDTEDADLINEYAENGCKFSITRGDYSALLKLVNNYLVKAKEYAANENERQMIENYIHSFRSGSLDAHKNGSRYWIQDKGPVIETYIGFIETYRDPAGVRAEFEGFVAIVNKPMSAVFNLLVSEAEKFLSLMPWPKEYEKDSFLRPDFTSLDVLTFSGSGIPIGICIPNYDEIRQNEGFKNVSLGNVILASYKGTIVNYLSAEDQELLQKYCVYSCDVQVGLHELLGHGSGKLFKIETDGTFNFAADKVVDYETKKKVTSWYEAGETYESVFSTISSSYEECRAECVGLYFSTFPDVLRVFGHEGLEAENVMYANWMSMCHKGVESLQMYEPSTKSWLQAHSQARYVILQVLLEAGGDFVKIQKVTGEDGNPDLLCTVNREKILSVGKPAIENFLKTLQLYKATANVNKAREMYNRYSIVSSEGSYPFLNYREIVMSRKKPRKMFVQPNTTIEDGKVVLKTYDCSYEGMIQSWINRFQENDLDKVLLELWKKDKPYFT